MQRKRKKGTESEQIGLPTHQTWHTHHAREPANLQGEEEEEPGCWRGRRRSQDADADHHHWKD
jgi:hypothetical protein